MVRILEKKAGSDLHFHKVGDEDANDRSNVDKARRTIRKTAVRQTATRLFSSLIVHTRNVLAVDGYRRLVLQTLSSLIWTRTVV